MPCPDPDTAPPSSKSELRAWARQRRRAIADDQRRAMDARIGQSLVAANQHMGLRCIAAFLAFDGEPDLRPALQQLSASGCLIALPVIEDGKNRNLTFHHWRPGDKLQRNVFGIEEPGDAPAMALDDIDIMLMPLAAWDRHGTRLGMGGGYYDRLLARYRHQDRPLRVGVAYSNQRCEHLPSESWDVPLHAILTESGWLPLPASAADNKLTDTFPE